MNDAIDDPRLRETVQQLETMLETPAPPGELADWAEDVASVAEDAHQTLQEHVRRKHSEIYTEIEEEDVALVQRVEQLKKQDSETLRRWGEFIKHTRSFGKQAENVEPDEATVSEYHEKLTKEGLSLIIEVRKQEAAIRTWLVESVQRDRGVGD